MRRRHKVLWPACFFLVMGAAALAVWTPSAIELQADAEARFVAGQQVAAKHPELATSWQKVAAAADPLNAAQADVNKCIAQQNALAGPLQATLRRVNELINGAYVDRNVRWMMPGDYTEYTEKKKTLDSLNAQYQALDDRLQSAQQRLQAAQSTYADAFKVYDEQLRQFQDEFNKVYQDEYPKRLKALQDLAKANQARLSQVFIVQDLLPGEYTWSESAKELGKVTITADNKVTGVPPDGREGTWKVTATGLEVTVGAETWLFRPGPMFTLMGSTKAAGAGAAVRQALLRPTTPPDQAAYNAALKKLKDAAKLASQTKAEVSAGQPGPTAAQPAAAPAQGQEQEKGMGPCIRLDGRTSYLNVKHSASLDLADNFTAELWVRLNSHSAGNPSVITRDNPDLGPWEMDLVGGHLTTQVAAGNWNATPPDTAYGPLPLGQWLHLAMVHDGPQVRVFVNGKKVAQYAAPTRLNVTSNDLKIGRSLYTGQSLDGMVREVRISDSARYTDEFKPQWRCERDEHTIVLLHCDEARGNVARDSSGNGNDAAIIGAQWVLQ